LKFGLPAAAGALLIVSAALWFVVMQPEQQSDPGQEAKALYDQGAEYIKRKDFESAVEILGQAHVLNPDDAGTLYALGVAYYKLGNVKLAKAYFTSVLEINPNDEQAKGLVDIMAGLERQSGAESEGEESTDH
jgi:tetratricopeptide (TPR) repeat protein